MPRHFKIAQELWMLPYRPFFCLATILTYHSYIERPIERPEIVFFMMVVLTIYGVVQVWSEYER